MKPSSRNFYRYKHMLVFFLTFLASLLAGLSISATIEKQRVSEKREQARYAVLIQADRISRVVDNLLSISQTLRALLEEGHGSIREFNRLIPDIIGDSPVRNVSLAPGGIITVTYPYAGNEASLGHDLLKDPDRVLEASMARESRKLTLSGPYELRQGGMGIVGRLPVYLEDENNRSFFWGFTCVTIDIPDGLSQANIANLERQGYSYELWRISPEDGSRQIIMQSNTPLLYTPQDGDVILPNSTWHLSIAPTDGWYRRDIIILDLALSILFALLCGFLAKSAAQLADSRYDLQISLNQQTDNYRLLTQLNEDLRGFRHDSNNHMLSLSSLLEKGDSASALEYIRTISSTLSDTVRIINTENYVFDAILAQKLYDARQKGIRTEQEIFLSRRLSIENGDWSTLFGNVLDNAIEACLQPSVSSPEIHVFVRLSGEMLRVCITNTAVCPQPSKGGTYFTNKTDRNNHGLGFRQIKSVIKKYHGTIETSWKDGIFSLSFLLLHI